MMDVGLHTEFDDPTSIIDPQVLAFAADINLGKFEGQIYNRLSAPPVAVKQDKFEVGARTRTSLSGVIGDGAAGGWNNSATTNLAMQATQIAVLTVGMILQVEDEVVVVSDVDRSGNTIDVFERGAGSTSAASHADQVAFEVIGHAARDVDAKNVESLSEQTEAYENYCQLIFVPIEQTFTDRTEARKYYENNPQLKKEALDKVFRLLSKNCVRGVKVTGSDSKSHLTAGILDQLSDTNGATRVPLRYNANGAFTEDKLKAALDLAFTKGSPDVIYLNPANKPVLNGLNEQHVRMTPGQARRAGLDNIVEYEYEGQVLTIVQDTAMPTSRVVIATESLIHKGWKQGDALRFVEEPPKSSRELRDSYQGKWFTAVRGVGRDHVDMYGIA